MLAPFTVAQMVHHEHQTAGASPSHAHVLQTIRIPRSQLMGVLDEVLLFISVVHKVELGLTCSRISFRFLTQHHH